MTRAYPIVKRLFDVVAAGLGLLVLGPLLAVTAAVIASTMGRPVLFRQTRPGLHGEPFVLVKFRSMTDALDAEGAVRTDAERLTSIGRFLRRTSLDELPELWNVVRGEMSLIGPRPLLMDYRDRYTPEQARRHEVRPGITGWAQVHGRNALNWPDRLRLDVWYVDHISLRLDVTILLKTVAQLLRPGETQTPGHATGSYFEGSD